MPPAARVPRLPTPAPPLAAPHRSLALALALALALTSSVAFAACTEHPFVDAAMETAHRPPRGARLAAAVARRSGYQLLAGDLHCHVSPPDHPSHAVRDAASTMDLARREGLDFVVLTPHVAARFYDDPDALAYTRAALAALAADVARADTRGLVVVAGFEYTDHAWGHVGAAFGDLDAALAPARGDGATFFDRYAATGGLLFVNHPLVVPVDAPLPIARADLSWRPLFARGPLPAEIAAADRLAAGFEAYNLAAAHLRDGLLRGDPDATLRATLDRIDREAVARGRRIVPVGGSDSHSFHLRATTFVLASERSAHGVRDALAAGRVCVRGPAACSVRARAPGGGAWAVPGEGIDAPGGAVEVTALGAPIEFSVDGALVAAPASGEVARVRVPTGRCSVLRARVGDGHAAPLFVNCPFARARRP